MLTVYNDHLPTGSEWVYQIKYDGFRCGLEWEKDSIRLWSRNGKELTKQFPEIIKACEKVKDQIESYLPLFLDGELTVLRTPFQAEFSLIQKRGRTRNTEKINQAAKERPATFICFDVLTFKGKDAVQENLQQRLSYLDDIFRQIGNHYELQLITTYKKLSDIEKIMELHQAEGIIAKNKKTSYLRGKRSEDWTKMKYYRSFPTFITGWNVENDYFDVSVFSSEEIIPCGKVKNGFSDNEEETLTTFIKNNGKKKRNEWTLDPSVCIEIHCLGVDNGELREPVFSQFRFDLKPEDCTVENVKLGLSQLPDDVEITKPDKLFFPDVTKRDYVQYIRTVAPFLLPRLMNKRLTTIRFPDGIHDKSFYQKHVPSYAPDFLESVSDEEGNYDIVCNNLESLLWLANHSAIEFHVPFQTVESNLPDEMVFDLDPPSLSKLSDAIKAAQLIRKMTEEKGFQPLVKTSGRTGLQLHIPLKEKQMTFQETRVFMEAVSLVLTENFPDLFTVERLKKNRKNRLYLDYVQHAPGKTIIAPYSCRATKEATVATPLFWEEVNEKLNPKAFTVHTIPDRLIDKGCPWLQST